MAAKNDIPQPQQSSNGQPSPGGAPSTRSWLTWLAVTLAFVAAWSYLSSNHHNATRQLSYTAFKQQVSQNHVKSITIKGQQVRGKLIGKAKGKSFTTVVPPISDPHLMDLLQSHHVTIIAHTTQSPVWVRLLTNLVPWVLLIAVFWYAGKKMRERMQGGSGGIFGIGKSRAKRVHEFTSSTRMEEVAGCENAKRDVTEIIDFLGHPERYHALGANIPKGVLLMGPPGTGKTILAKAVAGEAGVPFFSISGSEFVEMFVGVGASRVRDMFKQAKEASPAIIFIDEIDSIGRARGAGMGGGHDEREQTLNQILSEMDGFSPRETVVVMAATNRPDVLDPALLRPGRFDRKITFDLPGRQARGAILEVHARQTPCEDDVDFQDIAARTIGFSGADLANLVNEAAMLAARDRKEQIDRAAFDAAYNRIVLGARREDIMNDEEKRVIAFHESGHNSECQIIPSGAVLFAVVLSRL